MKPTSVLCFVALAVCSALSGLSCGRSETAAPAGEVKSYPLDTCLVCDMRLAGMKHPQVFIYRGQEIKVCDKGEQKDFEKDPETYLKKLAGSAIPK